MNDFYFELAVRVVEVCRDTKSENGGMIAVGEIVTRVQKGRGIGSGMEVSKYAVSSDNLKLSQVLIFISLATTFYEQSKRSNP